jgi:hypothetical protein
MNYPIERHTIGIIKEWRSFVYGNNIKKCPGKHPPEPAGGISSYLGGRIHEL